MTFPTPHQKVLNSVTASISSAFLTPAVRELAALAIECCVEIWKLFSCLVVISVDPRGCVRRTLDISS